MHVSVWLICEQTADPFSCWTMTNTQNSASIQSTATINTRISPFPSIVMTSCKLCAAKDCALILWSDALDCIISKICAELAEDILNLELVVASDGMPNNKIRKEFYCRLAHEHGWQGKRYKFEECIVDKIRKTFPCCDADPNYMGHCESLLTNS